MTGPQTQHIHYPCPLRTAKDFHRPREGAPIFCTHEGLCSTHEGLCRGLPCFDIASGHIATNQFS